MSLRLYRKVVVYEKKNRSLVFSGSRKIPTLGSTVQWETRQASFPTGTMGPRVGIFLSPLNTNDGFYLSHPHTHERSAYIVLYINIHFSRYKKIHHSSMAISGSNMGRCLPRLKQNKNNQNSSQKSSPTQEEQFKIQSFV